MESARHRPAPTLTGAVVAGLVAVAAWVLALVRPWGDTGVARDGSLATATPVAHVVGLGVGAGVVLVVAGLAARGRGHGAADRRFTRRAGPVVLALGAVLTVAVLAVTTAQVTPRDGGWWGLVSAAATGVAGLAVAVAGWWRPAGGRARVLTTVATTVVVVALAAVALVEAPRWPAHVVDGTHPASFSESAGPPTVTRVGWRQDFGAGTVSAVLAGRVVVAQDRESGGHCRLRVRALDAGTGATIWSSARTLRCDGPRLTGLDGNNTAVRITLRGVGGGSPLTGAATTLYLGTEDGRDLAPSSSLDAVRWWTEGFGLATSGARVQGLDARTGVPLWSRTLPRCEDGSAATLHLPDALPTGTTVSRTPYDGLGATPGSVPATSLGNDVVLALTCPTAVGSQRRVWLVDTADGPGADHVVALPTTDAGDDPTSFVPDLDTVVAIAPTAARTGELHPATVFGVDLASGRVLWQQPAAPLAGVDVAPADGRVTLSTVTPAAATSATVVLDGRTGAVRSTADDPLVTASVALTSARVQYDASAGVTVVDPRTGTRTIALPDCRADTGSGAAAMLAGPGGVVVRCLGPYGAGTVVVGLVP